MQFFTNSVASTTIVGRNATSAFPTITFCNFNYFNTPAGKKYLEETLPRYENLSSNKNESGKLKDYESRLNFVKASLLANKSVYNNIELRKSYGLNLNEMFLSCNFGSEPCNISDIEYFFDINFGNCYKFNSGFNEANKSIPLRKVITSGDSSGLQLTLYLGPQLNNNPLATSNGVYLAIHNRSFRGFLSKNGFNLPTGRTTNIGSFNLNE